MSITMSMMDTFYSLKAAWHFVTAREFESREKEQPFEHRPNLYEKVGQIMLYPTLKIFDHMGRNITNPLYVVAAVIVGVAVTTILFYPSRFIEATRIVFPFIRFLTPGVVRFSLYLTAQITTLGMGTRTFGRYSNHALCQRWKQQELCAVPLGAVLRV